MAHIDDIETLFKANYKNMYRLASAILHDADAAHDIVHDVFAAILVNHYKELPDRAYLMKSVRNQCLNRLKTIDVRERFRQLYLIEHDESDITDDWPDEETLSIIETVKNEMPPKCRKVFNMRFMEGLSASEISRIVGSGERVVYKHLRYALNLLKDRLNGKN